MLVTHGGSKAKRFEWTLEKGQVKILNENGRKEEYSLGEIINILNWLEVRFGSEWFPLANNVAKLGQRIEINGLGVSILCQCPGNISHAQGASYLGVVLEQIGILEWNNKQLGIHWRIIRPGVTLEVLKRALRAG